MTYITYQNTCKTCDKKFNATLEMDECWICESKHNDVTGLICSHCSRIQQWNSGSKAYRQRMLREKICFTCLHFVELKEKYSGHPKQVIVDSTHYFIGTEPDPQSLSGTIYNPHGNFLGFAGRRFDIEFFDGRKVTSHNLWCQGDIVSWLRPQMPDNAKFNWDHMKRATILPLR